MLNNPWRACARLTAIVTTTAFVSACTSPSTTPTPAPTPVGHVHGLGVNPADQNLYVATHTGVFRLNQTIERVGPAQDTMGFTVTGADAFLGSGHPAVPTDSTNLGLIRSTDAASTWQPVAFKDDADFHAIDVAGPWTYAYSSDRGLIRSKDLKAWTRITREGLYDIAADPQNSSRLLVTTDAGALRRLRVGETSEVLTGSPLMGPIDFARPLLVVGLGPGGEVYVSRNGGQTWTKEANLPGDAEAVDASATSWHAATSTGIYTSTDEGITWRPLFRVGKGLVADRQKDRPTK